jgi:hypothetical protein
MTLSAEQLFERLKQAIDRSVAEESFAIATSAAKAGGMLGGEKEGNVTMLEYQYEYTDSTQAKVTLVVKSWDTSSPFQIKPDRNKMTVELIHNGRTEQSFTDSYED